jgi:hypothetical protein
MDWSDFKYGERQQSAKDSNYFHDQIHAGHESSENWGEKTLTEPQAHMVSYPLVCHEPQFYGRGETCHKKPDYGGTGIFNEPQGYEGGAKTFHDAQVYQNTQVYLGENTCYNPQVYENVETCHKPQECDGEVAGHSGVFLGEGKADTEKYGYEACQESTEVTVDPAESIIHERRVSRSDRPC